MGWQVIINGITEAVRLIVTLDKQVIEITLRSLHTASLATFTASLIGLPLAVIIAMYEFPGKRTLRFTFNTLVGVPTVTLGLLLWLMFSRTGPLGDLSLLYTVNGMAVGQALLILPILVTFITSAIESKDRQLRDLAKTLGASDIETSIAILREAYNGVYLALISSFNRAFAELGIATMIGANIKGITRVLTTTIALETNRGEIGLSLALSFILLIVVFSLNYIIDHLRGA
jgi:tungstate transport system permease protein